MNSLLSMIPQQPQQPQMPQQNQAPQLPLSPQQAREQFCNQVAAMGWTSSQLNQFLDQVEQQARSLGIR